MATARLIRQPDRRLTGQKLAPRPSALIGPPGALARPAMAAAAARAVLEAGAAPPPLLPPPRGPGRPPAHAAPAPLALTPRPGFPVSCPRRRRCEGLRRARRGERSATASPGAARRGTASGSGGGLGDGGGESEN